MKKLLKKIRAKWHGDIAELSRQNLSAMKNDLDDIKKGIVEISKKVTPPPRQDKEVYVSSEARNERKRLIEMMKTIGTINQRALANAKICSNRADILQFMPKGKVCAEVGVAYGDFSRKILDVMEPSKFYAIDYFGGETGQSDFWGHTYVADSGLTHKQWYENKFKENIEQGVLNALQGYSWDVLETFPDAYFDYIYLDACHDYNSVSKDVEVIKRKIKNGGKKLRH